VRLTGLPDASPLLHQKPESEEVGLDVEAVEAPHVFGRVDAIESNVVHAASRSRSMIAVKNSIDKRIRISCFCGFRAVRMRYT